MEVRAEPGRRDPVDPALVSPALEVEVLDDVQRNVDRFDDVSTHVQHIQRPVRGVHEIHGPKPVSDERTNSVACSRGPRIDWKVGPSATRIRRWTRLF